MSRSPANLTENRERAIVREGRAYCAFADEYAEAYAAAQVERANILRMRTLAFIAESFEAASQRRD